MRRNYGRYAPRRIYDISDYPTPAKNNIKLLPESATTLDWVNAYQENITYIASWRAHLMFLLFIAYYDQHHAIQIGTTNLQYGKGIAPHIDAAHASFFPRVIDKDCRNSHLKHPHSSIIDNSFLKHWLSMTVPCPAISNRFDSFLEGRGAGSLFRQHTLFLLNGCSHGNYDPLIYMKNFFYTAEFAFKDRKLFIDKFESSDEKKAANHVIRLQKAGLFQFASPDDFTLENHYLEKVLLWDKKTQSRKTAYLRTQELLLTGKEEEAREFLKRFEPENVDSSSFISMSLY